MKQIGRIFGAPIVVEGKTWLPLAQLVTWGVMTWLAGRRRPQRTPLQRMAVGAVTMPVVLGSEWGHNLAHAAAANLMGKLADAIKIVGGMPRLIYHNVNDATVAPSQHILRSLAGPLFNISLLMATIFMRHSTPPKTLKHEVLDVAVGVNAFIGLVAFVPIPIIDGGPILKWSLVQRGCTLSQADSTVRKVDGVLGSILSGATLWTLKKRRWIQTALLAQLAALSLGTASGLIE